MATKKPPKYALHKGTGQARVRINGKDIYLGLYGSPESWTRYNEEVYKWQRQLEETVSELTIRQLTRLYLQFAKQHYRKNGKATSKVAVIKTALRTLNRHYRDLAANEFSPKRFKKIRETMIEADLARTTINDYMAVIRRMVRWAVSEELIKTEVLIAIQAVSDLQQDRTEARETDPVEAVSDACLNSLEGHVSDMVWAMMQLQRLTGMRPGEVRIMRSCDITKSGEVWEYRPSSHKMQRKKKQRIVPLGERAQAIIKSWLRPELDAYLFSPLGSNGSRPYTKDAYCRAITRGCEEAFGMPEHLKDATLGLEKKSKSERKRTIDRRRKEASEWRRLNAFTPNQIRHTYATAARREFGIEGARTVLGHAKADTTEIYAERDLDAARAIAAKIG